MFVSRGINLLPDVQDLKAVPMADPETSVPDVTLSNGGI